jgi:predicted CoA-binding protein
MDKPIRPTPAQVLKKAKTILLVDWPNPDVPRALLEAGFTVYSYSPDKYSVARLEGNDVLFEKLEGSPGQVDIVNVFRPEKELPEITEKHVIPLKAKILWLQPPLVSAWAAEFATEYQILFIEGADIAEVAGELKSN